MSVGKVGTVKSSANAIDYILKERKGEKKPKLIGGNALGSTKQEIKDEFHAQETLNFKVQNAVVHIVISFPPNTEITDEFAAEYVDRLMENLGYKPNLYIAARHFDKEERQEDPYSHLHVVGSRIRDDGSLITEWKSAEQVIAATKKIDEEMGLESVEFVKNGEERNIKKDEYRVMQKYNKLSVMESFKDAAKKTLSEISSPDPPENSVEQPRKINRFVQKMQEAGFEVLPSFDEVTQKMRGFSFKKDHIIFTAAKGWKPLKWENLKEAVGYQTDQDHQFLVGLKEEISSVAVIGTAPAEKNSSRTAIRTADRVTEKPIQPVEKAFTKSPENNRSLIETDNRQTAEKVKNMEFNNPVSVIDAEDERSTVKHKIGEVKINEETVKLRTKHSKSEPVGDGERNQTTSKAELETRETSQILVENNTIESDSSMVEVETFAAEFTEAGSDGAADRTTQKRKIISGDHAAAAEADRGIGSENRIGETKGKLEFGNSTSEYSNQNREGEDFKLGNSGVDSREQRIEETHRLLQKGVEQDLQGLSILREQVSETEAGFIRRIEFGRDDNSGVPNAPQRNAGSGKFEIERGNDTGSVSERNVGEANESVSVTDEERGKPGAADRAKNGEVGRKGTGDSESINRPDIDPFNSRLSLFEHLPKFIRTGSFTGGESEDGAENSLRRTALGDDPSSDEELFQPGTIQTAASDLWSGESDSQTAERAVLLINIKYFSGQLDERIASWWQAKIAENEPRTILNKVLEPKIEDEENLLFRTVAGQSEMIAASLNLPKPEAAPVSDVEKLAQTLVGIEAANFESATGNAVSDKTFERLLAERLIVADEPPTAEQNREIGKQFAEYAAVPIFSSKLEIEVFNALLNPEAIEFDAARILKIQEQVRIDEIAALETATLIQIAFGGQTNVFTDEFKSALAEKVYLQPDPATNIYHDFRNFDWENTVDEFSEIVEVLAEEYQAPLLIPSDDARRNELLADFLTESLVNSYQGINNSADEVLRNNLFDMAVDTGALGVLEYQTTLIAKNMAEGFEPPVFGNALEADIYNFAKSDSATQIELSESVVDYVYQNEQSAIEEPVEVEKQATVEKPIEVHTEERLSPSNALAM